MPVSPVAENVCGTIGTICWTIQLVPQLWKSFREKDTQGLSDSMILAWSVAGAFLGVYSIVKNLNIPLILQPQVFGVLCLASWAQCQYYGRKHSLRRTLLSFALLGVIMGGFEVGMVYALRQSYNRGEESGNRGVEFFGIMSSVIIALSFIPQYYEIYHRREVVGISLLFMLVDILGGVFSDLSLAFKSGNFDIIAAITYTLVIVMDGVIVLAAGILNPRARRRRRQQEEEVADLETIESGHGFFRGPANLNNQENDMTQVQIDNVNSEVTPESVGVASNSSASASGTVTGNDLEGDPPFLMAGER